MRKYTILSSDDLEKVYCQFCEENAIAEFVDETQFHIKLIVYELVGNVLKHAKCKAILSYEKVCDKLSIFVDGDCGCDLPPVFLPKCDCECGRGRYIVDCLCSEYRYENGGKTACCSLYTDPLKTNILRVKKIVGNNILVAATKTVDIERLKKSMEYGIEIFGENKVQELLDKYSYFPSMIWHFIGHLQTNKVKYIVDKVELIHSVDSLHLLEEVNRQARKIGKIQNILLQLNIAREASKGGFLEEEIFSALETAKSLESVCVQGIMCMLPLVKNIENNVNFYLQVKHIYDIMNVDKAFIYLSMGMSDDFALAIEHGANTVRVGSAIFGKRD